MKKSIFLIFTIVLSCYFMGYSIIMGFAPIFLQYRGFSNLMIGVFFALSSVLCIIFQGGVGRFLDNSPIISAKHVFLLLNAVSVLCAVLIYYSKNILLTLILYIIIGSSQLSLSTFSATLGMEYINAGLPLNFPFARGTGSFFYACTTLIMGFVVQNTSIRNIFPVFFIVQFILLTVLLLLPAPPKTSSNKEAYIKENGYLAFFRRYPWALFLLISILLMYTSYSSINNFHINIIRHVGGNNQHFGISTSIAAFLELPAMAAFLPLSKKFEYKKLLCFSCSFFLIKTIVLLFSSSIWTVYLSQCLQFFSYGLFVPASSYFFNSVLADKDKSKGQSLIGIFTFGLGGFISSLISGALLDYFGISTLLLLECILCMIGLTGIFITFKKFTQLNIS